MLFSLKRIERIGEGWDAIRFEMFLKNLDAGALIKYDKSIPYNQRFIIQLEARHVVALAGAGSSKGAEAAVAHLATMLEHCLYHTKIGRTELAPYRVTLWQDVESTQVLMMIDTGWVRIEARNGTATEDFVQGIPLTL